MARDGIVISLRGLNAITFNDTRTEVVIQGGCLVKEVGDAAFENDAHVINGTCNAVGALGAGLGGGYGNLTGMYGLAVNNMLSLNVVMADGSSRVVTESSDPDLFWALRGAAPNFGIVTSATYRAYPMAKEKNMAFTGALFFEGDKIEGVIEALGKLELKDNMSAALFLRTSGPPAFQPFVMVIPFFFGSEEEGKKAFSCLYDLGPMQDMMGHFPANHWNDGADAFCTKGGRKPFYGAAVNKLDPKTWRSIWNEYTDFLKDNQGSGFSAIILECYPMGTARRLSTKSPTAFPWGDRDYSIIVCPWYEDASTDPAAIAYGRRVRDLLRAADGTEPAS
jgi:hypothetical protein